MRCPGGCRRGPARTQALAACRLGSALRRTVGSLWEVPRPLFAASGTLAGRATFAPALFAVARSHGCTPQLSDAAGRQPAGAGGVIRLPGLKPPTGAGPPRAIGTSTRAARAASAPAPAPARGTCPATRLPRRPLRACRESRAQKRAPPLTPVPLRPARADQGGAGRPLPAAGAHLGRGGLVCAQLVSRGHDP